MRFFIAIILFMTRFELAIARATGSNFENISQLQADESKWEKELLLLDLNS